MEFVVNGTPSVCLGLVRSYFEGEEWPYREKSEVSGPDITGREVSAKVPNSALAENPLGCLALIVLSVLTLGSFLVVYLIWQLVRDEVAPNVVVTADPVGPDKTRLTVQAFRRAELAELVGAWIQRELVENEAAAPRAAGDSTYITEHIQRLAELRDSGALTEEEFQAKKKELLDRM